MRPLLKVLIPYLLIGLGIGAVWLVATECLQSAPSEPQIRPSPAADTIKNPAPAPTPVSAAPAAPEMTVAPPLAPASVAPGPTSGLNPHPGYADREFPNAMPVAEVLESSRVSVERRQVRLPLAGAVTLSISRTRPGAARTMDLLEHAVRTAEDLMGRPFPVRYVALRFDEAVADSYTGINFGTHSAILPRYDTPGESGQPGAAGGIIAHEVAHYYWNRGEVWLDEGAAEFMAAYSELARTGAPLEPDNYPCGAARGIRELEAREYTRDAPGYVCNYALGERLFLDLYRTLGENAFRRGFRKLNDLVAEGKADAGHRAGIAEVRQAFASETGPNVGESATGVIARWYSGGATGREHGPDNRPVVAELPDVYGWIDRAYVSLEEAGSPVKAFAAADGGDWAWLTLEYSHDYAGPPTELTFEVVEYYEDGFPYRRNSLTIGADRSYSGGVQWLSVGPGPGQTWAPGRHWIYVHHEGRKVAQVEFEVTR